METRIAQTTTSDYNREIAATTLPGLTAVSWGAIFAGAAAAAVLSLILLLLGTGLGLSSVSPWANAGISGTTFGVTTILWITITSLIASAAGGYIAGRLRTRWIDTQRDEIYFRDTAHGFLAWAVATLFTATLLTSTISAVVSGAAQVGASAVGGAAATATAATAAIGSEAYKSESRDKSLPYFLDSLFRKNIDTATSDSTTTSVAQNDNSPKPGTTASKAEVAHIYINALTTSDVLPPEDVKYAGQVVAQETGLSQAEAEKRATDTYTAIKTKLHNAEVNAREAADKTRKATAYGTLWLFISLLIGAFIASWTAIYGGRQRDL